MSDNVPASDKPAAATPAAPAPAAPPAPVVKPEIKYDDFAKLDLRVAKVLAAREHPNANKLLLLQIQVGEVQKQIVVVNNLEQAMIRGEESNGMLLAASDGQGVVLLKPDREVAGGSLVK